MAGHVLEREQLLGTGIDQAWTFFSDPRNLSRITPDGVGFRIHDMDLLEPMHEGQLIRYTVSPVLGIPMRWVTRIGSVQEPHLFEDIQLRGPYASWRHVHTFERIDGGVRMRDRVEYELPMALLGEWAHRAFVRKKLETIFDHRAGVLQDLFPYQGR